VHGRLVSAMVARSQLVWLLGWVILPRHDCFIQSGRMDSPHRLRIALGRLHDPGLLAIGQKGPNREQLLAIFFDLVRPQNLKGVLQIAIKQRTNTTEWNLRTQGLRLQFQL